MEKKNAFNEVQKVLLPFATTCLCEAGFSALVNIKTNARNCLDPQYDIRCALTKLEPRYQKFVMIFKVRVLTENKFPND